MPTRNATISAKKVSSRVAAPKVVKTSVIGRRSLIAVPKSPCRRLPRYSQYWTRSGRS
jgi:hypothetical protein